MIGCAIICLCCIYPLPLIIPFYDALGSYTSISSSLFLLLFFSFFTLSLDIYHRPLFSICQYLFPFPLKAVSLQHSIMQLLCLVIMKKRETCFGTTLCYYIPTTFLIFGMWDAAISWWLLCFIRVHISARQRVGMATNIKAEGSTSTCIWHTWSLHLRNPWLLWYNFLYLESSSKWAAYATCLDRLSSIDWSRMIYIRKSM